MNPIFNLMAGIAAGAIGTRLWKQNVSRQAIEAKMESGTDAVRSRLTQAGEGMRAAAVSGLSAVERGSGDIRRRIEAPPVEPEPPKKTAAKKAAKKVAGKVAAKKVGK